MIDGGTVKVAIHALQRRRAVVVRVGGEDDIPQAINQMDLGSPQVGAVWLPRRREKEQLFIRIVPVSAAIGQRCRSAWDEDADPLHTADGVWKDIRT